MTNRLLSIRYSAQEQCHHTATTTTGLFGMLPSQPLPGTYRYFVRGRSYKPGPEEHLVSLKRKKKLKEYDKCLKRFQYKKALDAALINVCTD